MSYKTEEIRKRHERDDRLRGARWPRAHADRAFLLAEVDWLRTENARLRARVEEYFREPDTHPVEREK